MPNPVYVSGGTEAQRQTAVAGFLEPIRTTNQGRLFIGGQTTSQARELDSTYYGNSNGANFIEGVSINEVLYWGYRRHLLNITVGAGSGAFTASLVLPDTLTGADESDISPRTGDTLEYRILFAASANPTLQIYLPDGTTVAWQSSGDAGSAKVYNVKFLWTGTNWWLWNANLIPGATA